MFLIKYDAFDSHYLPALLFYLPSYCCFLKGRALNTALFEEYLQCKVCASFVMVVLEHACVQMMALSHVYQSLGAHVALMCECVSVCFESVQLFVDFLQGNWGCSSIVINARNRKSSKKLGTWTWCDA